MVTKINNPSAYVYNSAAEERRQIIYHPMLICLKVKIAFIMKLIYDRAKELPGFILRFTVIQTHFIHCSADALSVHLTDLQAETNNTFPSLCLSVVVNKDSQSI